jgi:hypothetical protein
MKRILKNPANLLIMVLAMAFTISCSEAAANPASKAKNERWEYVLVKREASNAAADDAVIKKANELGSEGWELVGTYGGYNSGLLLKRMLP